MKNIKKVIIAALIGALTLSSAGCGVIEKTPEGDSKTVVATVYGTKITKGEVDAEIKGEIDKLKETYKDDYKKNSKAMESLKNTRASALDMIINTKIILKKAEEFKLVPSAEEMAKQVEEKVKEFKEPYKTEEEFKKALSDSGLTEDKLKEQAKNYVIAERLYNHVVKDVKVTEEQAKSEYALNQSNYATGTNRIKPAHILVQTEEEAKAIIDRLNKGEDFAKLAKEKGTDGTKDNGGDLGWINYNSTEYDKTFLVSALSLEKGKYTPDPVHTQFGYHVIKCLDKEEYPIKPFSEVKDEIMNTLLGTEKQKKYREEFAKWQEAAKITTNQEELGK